MYCHINFQKDTTNPLIFLSQVRAEVLKELEYYNAGQWSRLSSSSLVLKVKKGRIPTQKIGVYSLAPSTKVWLALGA